MSEPSPGRHKVEHEHIRMRKIACWIVCDDEGTPVACCKYKSGADRFVAAWKMREALMKIIEWNDSPSLGCLPGLPAGLRPAIDAALAAADEKSVRA